MTGKVPIVKRRITVRHCNDIRASRVQARSLHQQPADAWTRFIDEWVKLTEVPLWSMTEEVQLGSTDPLLSVPKIAN